MRRICLAFYLSFMIISVPCAVADNFVSTISFNKEAQVEVGGPYAGVELHKGSFLPTRITFFYPVSNSIQMVNDYWTREDSHIMDLGLKFGDQPKQWLTDKPDSFDLSPHSVKYLDQDDEKSISVSYEFTDKRPALVLTIVITNKSDTVKNVEFFTSLDTALKTSHSFNLKDSAWTEYDDNNSTIYTNFDDSETQQAQVFVANAGEQPVAYSSAHSDVIGPPEQNEPWFKSDHGGVLLSKKQPARPASSFLYQKSLQPNHSMTIVHLIGSVQQGEGQAVVADLLDNYVEDVATYQAKIADEIKVKSIITGDPVFDESTKWAQGIMAANSHYIDHDFVPMPEPAEYNFYFAHDVLVADMAAVNFDLGRVKTDLEYLLQHTGKDFIIPHAYYWKDSQYVTEYATPENWLHYWFTIVCAKYLRHSNDQSLLHKLYPAMQKSMSEILTNLKTDNLIYAYQPDWWDIGHNYGPRAYMNILAVKSLRELAYVATKLGKKPAVAVQYENTAKKIESSLETNLWDEKLGYLMNGLEDKSQDDHYYIGSLISAHFNTLDKEKTKVLVNTATQKLLDPQLGIYNAYPMDFHTLIDEMKFQGNEAGAVGKYMNGGIWPHGNTWYSLALTAVGKNQEAAQFIKKTMTLDGIMHSPNGQPAMYEYRDSNKANKQTYGKVDKPTFLWAASWYIYALYDLYGVRENEWNISFQPYLPADSKNPTFDIYANGYLQHVNITGTGTDIANILFNGVKTNSAVLPSGISTQNNIEIVFGKTTSPYLASTDSALISSKWQAKEQTLEVILAAFAGHQSAATFVSPTPVINIKIDGIKNADFTTTTQDNHLFTTTVKFRHLTAKQILNIEYSDL